MRKRYFGMAVLFAAALLSACGGGEQYDPNALNIMGKRSDLEKSYMKRIFDLYREETGKRLNIIEFEDARYETAASEKFEKGEAPDIFMHFHNADLRRFNVEENFYDLSGESWVSDLTDGARNYCTDSDGNLLGLPFWESSVSGCYYNKKIFERFGFSAATTQREFDSLCATFAAAQLTPICWPANGCSWMPQFGLDPIFADDPELLEKLNSNEVTFEEIPEVRNMVQWISDAADKGWFGEEYLQTGWDEISGALSSGNAVMTFIWDTWFYTDFKPGKYTVDDFALMPVFLNTVEGGTYEGGNLNMMMVNKNSEKLQEALEFLSFCAAPEHYNVAFQGISTVSCFKGQTTNIQSKMVTDAKDSIAKRERVSTAATKIYGYSADDIASLLNEMFRKTITVDGCVKRMEELRVSEAKKQNIPGF